MGGTMNLYCRLFGHKWEWEEEGIHHRSTHCKRCKTRRDEKGMRKMMGKEGKKKRGARREKNDERDKV